MNFDDLSPELQEKLKAAKTPDEIIALAKEENYNLSDEELEEISGGLSWNSCPHHNSKPCPQRKSKPPTYGRE